MLTGVGRPTERTLDGQLTPLDVRSTLNIWDAMIPKDLLPIDRLHGAGSNELDGDAQLVFNQELTHVMGGRRPGLMLLLTLGVVVVVPAYDIWTGV